MFSQGNDQMTQESRRLSHLFWKRLSPTENGLREKGKVTPHVTQCGVGGGRFGGSSQGTLGPAVSAPPESLWEMQPLSSLRRPPEPESAFYWGDSNAQQSLRSPELCLICQSRESTGDVWSYIPRIHCTTWKWVCRWPLAESQTVIKKGCRWKCVGMGKRILLFFTNFPLSLPFWFLGTY